MALYQNITITDAGSELISRIITTGGEPLTFEAVAIGSGQLATDANPSTFSGLITEEKRLPIEAVERAGGRITVTARLATDTLSADLIHREVGIYANGVLLAYGNTGNNYDYIPAAGKNAAVQKTIRIPLAIGTMQTTFAEMDSSDLVTHAALESRIATLVEPAVRSIFSEELTNEAFEQAARNVAREVAEEANAGAYAAQVKAEEAAAHALVSETNINLALEEVSEHIADDERHVTPYVRKQLDNVLFQSNGGTVSTGESTYEMSAYAFLINNPPAGKCKKITLNISSNAADIDSQHPFYLVVLEDDGTGNYIARSISRERLIQIADTTATYTFSNLVLSGAKIKLAYCRDTSMASMPDIMGLKVTSANGEGLAYTDRALSVTAAYIPAMTFDIEGVSTAFWNINGYERYKNSKLDTLPEKDNFSEILYAVSMLSDNSELKSIDGLKMRSVLNTAAMCMNCTALTSAKNVDCFMSHNATSMYQNCTQLTDISGSSFEYTELAASMFRNCDLRTTGGAVFSHIVFATGMFAENNNLEEITSSVKLGRLQAASDMFAGCKLNLASVQHIASSINHIASGSITIGINKELEGNAEIETALNTIRSKGWGVTVEYNA